MTGHTLIDPATGETGRTVPFVDERGLEEAIALAHRASREWGRRTTVAERAALVARLGELHTEHREELAAAIVREMGKPMDQALGEVDFCADIYAYTAEIAESELADQEIVLRGDATGRALVRSAPYGVLLGVMPWNFPAYQVARFAGPNLAAGNTILLKHAPACPESAAIIARLAREAGFPEGAYVDLVADNDQVATVIADPRVAGVSLTGSERAGRAVAETAGRHLKKVVLELGGSDPFIVLSTDDLDATVEQAVAARLDNNGQSCNAAKRMLVVDGLYDAFLEKFTAALLAVRPGSPTADGTQLGPLSSSAAAERLQEQLDRAVAHGATAHRAAERDGTFFAPVVLTDVTADNPVYAEELFGPVATVYRVADEEEAVRVANDTSYGLGSYVVTTDPEQAMRVADALETGMVFVNTVLADAAELPFGGVKSSGFGRELGRAGFVEFVNRKLIRIA